MDQWGRTTLADISRNRWPDWKDEQGLSGTRASEVVANIAIYDFGIVSCYQKVKYDLQAAHLFHIEFLVYSSS